MSIPGDIHGYLVPQLAWLKKGGPLAVHQKLWKHTGMSLANYGHLKNSTAPLLQVRYDANHADFKEKTAILAWQPGTS